MGDVVNQKSKGIQGGRFMKQSSITETLRILTISIVIAVLFPPSGSPALVPDTEETRCFDDTAEIPCPSPRGDWYGQDANYAVNPRQCVKLGTGGEVLDDSAPEWIMVEDRVTGLVWEIKTEDGSVHDRNYKTGWHDAGDAVDGYIALLNSEVFGGFTDWRLPTINELAGLARADRTGPTIDTDYFPRTAAELYWSSLPDPFDADFCISKSGGKKSRSGSAPTNRLPDKPIRCGNMWNSRSRERPWTGCVLKSPIS